MRLRRRSTGCRSRFTTATACSNAPDWFDCFSSTEIGEALETGQALAFLGVENIEYGIDRVVAVLPDGRGFAWHQINRCGERVFDGDPPPEGCPLPPERTE